MRNSCARRVTSCVIWAIGAVAEAANGQSADNMWTDTPAARVEAMALLESLNAELLSNDSATLTLDRWCETHKMATPARVEADRVHGIEKGATEEIRQLLHVNSTEAVRFRHVRLHCGSHVLSEADNWYVPARLTPEMNRVLDTTDTPFGRTVQALDFRRRTLTARLLWSPLPEGWEMQTRLPPANKRPLLVPAEVIQHRAILYLPDATPFSVVVETYTNEVLNFPEPPNTCDERPI
jgi:chorismate-pyruvate lyase